MDRQPTNDVLLLPTSDTSDGFRPKGTPLRGGVFVLANTLLGAGMLGLPAAFADCGYAVGLALLVFFASLGALGLTLLAYAADRAGRPASIYSVAEAALPGLGVLLDAAIAIKCFGVATSYLIVVGDTLPDAVRAFGGGGLLLERRLWTLVAVCFAGVLAFFKRISALRYTALAALACVLAITMMVVLFALNDAGVIDAPALDPCGQPANGTAANGTDPHDCEGPTAWATDGMATLRALPIFVFAYTCHQNVISTTNEMAQPTRGRIARMTTTAVGTALAVYIALACSGYATFGSKVASDILSSYPPASPLVGVARVMIALVVTCCYPLQAHPSRLSLGSIIKKVLGPARAPSDAALHWGITAAFVGASTAIALVVDDLGVVLKVVGATGSTIVSYILPGSCYFLLYREPHTLRWAALALLVAGAVTMPLSLTLIFLPA